MKNKNWWKNNLAPMDKILFRELYKRSFYAFAREFWNEADPQEFIDGIVVQIFCEIAQYFTRGWIKYEEKNVDTAEYIRNGWNVIDVREGKMNVSVAVCPRHSKTMVFSVLYPVWAQLNRPLKVAAISHTTSLAVDINKKRQKIMNSEKFKFFFPEIVLETNTNHSIKTTNSGELYAVARESATGFGADILDLDDIVNAAQARRDKTEMENAFAFMTDTLPSRVNDVSKYVIMNIAQRLAPNDIEGRIRDNPTIAAQYSFVTLPAQFDVDTAIVCPISGKIFEFRAGSFLWPERFGNYEKLKSQVGDTVWKTQYLQKPQYADSNVIKEEMIVEEDVTAVPDISQADMIYASHDFPVKDKETSDFLGSIIAYRVKGRLYIKQCVEEKMAFTRSMQYVRSLTDRYPGIIQIIEDKANGAPIIQQAQEEVPGIQPFQPGTNSKQTRLELASYYMGNVIFVRDVLDAAQGKYVLSKDTYNLKKKLLAFPYLEHDDIVDALSMLVIFVFADKRYSVYGSAFNEKNIITKEEMPVIKNHTVFFNKEGNNWKALDIYVKYGVQTKLYITREIEFTANVDDGLLKLKEFCPEKAVFIDCSYTSGLKGLYRKGISIEYYQINDFEKSVADLNLAFSKDFVFLLKECKSTKQDIENFKYDKNKDTENSKTFKSRKDGFVACIRMALHYFGGIIY